MKKSKVTRCQWAGKESLMCSYHDEEWGVPVHEDNKHFEFLILELSQAGLSWLTVLRKRESYRKAYDNFDPEKIAKWNAGKINKLLKDTGIIRNKLKVEAAKQNAQAYLKIIKEY